MIGRFSKDFCRSCRDTDEEELVLFYPYPCSALNAAIIFSEISPTIALQSLQRIP